MAYNITMVNVIFKTRKTSKVHNNDQIVLIFSSRMNKLVYIYVRKEFVIGQVVLKLLSKGLAVAMVHKTVDARTCKTCECMIATSQNMDNLDSHMYHVLYFGVLIRSSC
jgi:hypothetical protein